MLSFSTKAAALTLAATLSFGFSQPIPAQDEIPITCSEVKPRKCQKLTERAREALSKFGDKQQQLLLLTGVDIRIEKFHHECPSTMRSVYDEYVDQCSRGERSSENCEIIDRGYDQFMGVQGKHCGRGACITGGHIFLEASLGRKFPTATVHEATHALYEIAKNHLEFFSKVEEEILAVVDKWEVEPVPLIYTDFVTTSTGTQHVEMQVLAFPEKPDLSDPATPDEFFAEYVACKLEPYYPSILSASDPNPYACQLTPKECDICDELYDWLNK